MPRRYSIIVGDLPRPFGRGLIEARVPGPSRVPDATLPRPIGRGLIEAIRPADVARSCWRLPRPIGRGLIEARCSARWRSSRALPFLPRPIGRGLIEAPPSLVICRPCMDRTFRDRSVAASLKQSVAYGLRVRSHDLPRPFGRGLIEAVVREQASGVA